MRSKVSSTTNTGDGLSLKLNTILPNGARQLDFSSLFQSFSPSSNDHNSTIDNLVLSPRVSLTSLTSGIYSRLMVEYRTLRPSILLPFVVHGLDRAYDIPVPVSEVMKYVNVQLSFDDYLFIDRGKPLGSFYPGFHDNAKHKQTETFK